MDLRLLLVALAALPLLTGTALAGDPAKGENDFKRCRSCHAIVNEEGDAIVRGGKTGPNLYGVIGRKIASVDGYKYGESLRAVGETGLFWDEESLAAYLKDPKAWLAKVLDDPGAKSKMTYKHRKRAEDMAAYLASIGSENGE
jgi:cytochrome c